MRGRLPAQKEQDVCLSVSLPHTLFESAFLRLKALVAPVHDDEDFEGALPPRLRVRRVRYLAVLQDVGYQSVAISRAFAVASSQFCILSIVSVGISFRSVRDKELWKIRINLFK